MVADFFRWLFRTETSVVKSFEEVLLSFGLLNILAVVMSVIYFLNPFVIAKTVQKIYKK